MSKELVDEMSRESRRATGEENARGSVANGGVAGSTCEFGVWGLGIRVWGFEVEVWGLRFGVWGMGFKLYGSGFRVQGAEFRGYGFVLTFEVWLLSAQAHLHASTPALYPSTALEALAPSSAPGGYA